MSTMTYSHELLVRLAKLTQEDLKEINQRRQPYTRLGFAYQLAHVRLFNRFPAQISFEAIDEILTFVSVQLDISVDAIQDYTTRQQTISEHQGVLSGYV